MAEVVDPRPQTPQGELTSWRRLQMEAFSALLALCAGNSPVTGDFPSQRPVTRSFNILFDLRPNKRLSKESWDWWFETPPRSLWRHCNASWKCKFDAQEFRGVNRIKYFNPEFQVNATTKTYVKKPISSLFKKITIQRQLYTIQEIASYW